MSLSLVDFFCGAGGSPQGAAAVPGVTVRLAANHWDRCGLATGSTMMDVDDVLFRMLKPPEIGRAMSFADDYIVLGTQRERIRQYGKAVTPPVAEVLVGALVEAITGQRHRDAADGLPPTRQGIPT